MKGKVNKMETKGRIHSIETCGTVDGPGIRVVLFLQGCHLRCKYCHNPDTWNMCNGKEITVKEAVEEILKYEPYMRKSGGGVTVSGGEPLLQAEFLEKLFKELKKYNINIALDTSGNINIEKVKKTIKYVDIFLLDIKSMNEAGHLELTGAKLKPVLEFLNYIQTLNKKIWLRHVLIPGLTGSTEELIKIRELKEKYNCVEKIEILPFHKMGEYKWKEMGYNYTLSEAREPTKEEVINAMNIVNIKNKNV